ncbi:hypothetical protein QJS24_gp42 [Serratia phage vB_SmaS_Rovert]|uniref:Uncharacterized protein n=1 Tax=Serratia phage vB_SmaS_Rovert TaxID=2777363 RepID=A0A7T3TL17_9CAUD|nr:hypothetical protein QJS24_gp42 [Serratia phage vB_SmaS_Rovert]QPX75009.1 hypothetical protein [Serratia phage vB_SmaS_Rovert]
MTRKEAVAALMPVVELLLSMDKRLAALERSGTAGGPEASPLWSGQYPARVTEINDTPDKYVFKLNIQDKDFAFSMLRSEFVKKFFTSLTVSEAEIKPEIKLAWPGIFDDDTLSKEKLMQIVLSAKIVKRGGHPEAIEEVTDINPMLG